MHKVRQKPRYEVLRYERGSALNQNFCTGYGKIFRGRAHFQSGEKR
jgi:hypothetical protein